ncbi:outer membrane lipoprotein chaperone LolA [Dokdonella sp.]|uniref:outer membrane lipoprotein chaperone LolA n=1 Tax=Dokdonella sp. TaxID=2291710 RepID=UPI002B543756|nr:outer membrane lipoprotein chaperone LolA [Dokdonella sp.]HQX34602.1 outer membrane lipoprotein chaperone LolA [Dokdonella sp.]
MHKILALLLLSLVSSPVCAADSARARLAAFSADLHSVSASFEQSVTGASGHRGEVSSGKMMLQAPRQLRWHTTSPFEQLIVADGSKVWIYDPDLEQVSVRKQGAEEAHSPLTVLTDLGQLDAEFVVSEAGERDGLRWLKLVSRASEPEFAFAELGFAESDLARMRFEDALGNTTEIRFSDWKRDPRLPADTFSFSPPAGVDVVGDAEADAEVFPIKD